MTLLKPRNTRKFYYTTQLNYLTITYKNILYNVTHTTLTEKVPTVFLQQRQLRCHLLNEAAHITTKLLTIKNAVSSLKYSKHFREGNYYSNAMQPVSM